MNKFLRIHFDLLKELMFDDGMLLVMCILFGPLLYVLINLCVGYVVVHMVCFFSFVPIRYCRENSFESYVSHGMMLILSIVLFVGILYKCCLCIYREYDERK